MDLAVIHELNIVNPPKIKGYTYFHTRVDKKFMGTAIYITIKWLKHVTKDPNDKNSVDMKIIHLGIRPLPTLAPQWQKP